VTLLSRKVPVLYGEGGVGLKMGFRGDFYRKGAKVAKGRKGGLGWVFLVLGDWGGEERRFLTTDFTDKEGDWGFEVGGWVLFV
jgi:hypothetical protein